MFRYSYPFLLAALAAAHPTLVRDANAATYPCTDGVFILAARGADGDSLNPFGVSPNYQDVQGLEVIAQVAINKVGHGSYYRPLPYAAVELPVLYTVSVSRGIDIAQDIIRDYISRCRNVGKKNPRIVLLGYSEGAETFTDALIGGYGRAGLDEEEQKYIAGGALFGDPDFVPGFHPIDAGNATKPGLRPKSAGEYAYYNDMFGNRLRNYCQAGDATCSNTLVGGLIPPAIDIHLAAVKAYTQAASDFLVGIL